MRTYAISRQVHSTLNKALFPWFRERGWTKRKGSTCAFVKPCELDGKHWCFWVQVNPYGGSDFGNSFTVNLEPQLSTEGQLFHGPHARVLENLSKADREAGLALETKIVGRIPKPAPGSKIYEWMNLPGAQGEMFRHSWERSFIPHPECWVPGMDIWLRYYATDDVEEWGAFLMQRLPLLTARSDTNAT